MSTVTISNLDADLKLDIAFWNYDRTRALADGTTRIPGIAATYHTAPIVTQIHCQVFSLKRYSTSLQENPHE